MKTRIRWIPQARASFNPSINARYSATLWVAGPIAFEI
jgi:hypothetical protein